MADVTVWLSDQRKSESTGYEINLYRGERLIDSYHSTGNPKDSGQPGISETSRVRKWARRTAKDMFEEKFNRKPKPGEIVLQEERHECC
jgi:hypothetical protein